MNVAKISSDPISMPLDFVVTEKHIVLLMPPLNYQESGGQKSFLTSHEWQPKQATRVLVVDKNDFSKHRWLELPSQWVFHFDGA
jgi:all-trans-8'-apo-beta-carotenal 15,15'-oxygenase